MKIDIVGVASYYLKSDMGKEDKIGELLVEEGVISQEQLDDALEKQKGMYSGTPLGELLIEQGMVEESEFLKVLAKQFSTQYVTTMKLAELNIPSAILRLVPQATAEKHLILPIQYQNKNKSLSIVTADPLNMGAVDEVKFASGIGNIKCLIATKSAVNAGIDKFYNGNDRAFDFAISVEGDEDSQEGVAMDSMFTVGSGHGESEMVIEPEGDAKPSNAPASDDAPLEIASMDEAFGKKASSAAAPAPKPDPDAPLDIGVTSKDDGVYLGGMESFPGDDNLQREPKKQVTVTKTEPSPAEKAPKTSVREKAKVAREYHRRMILVEPHSQIKDALVKLFGREGFEVQGVPNREGVIKTLKKADFDVVVIKERNVGEGTEFEEKLKEIKPEVELYVIKDYGAAMIGETRLYSKIFDSFFETLDVVIKQMEKGRGAFEGHTHDVAKYTKLISQKLSLGKRDSDEARIASYAHELGKRDLKHYTLLDTLNPDLDTGTIQDTIEIPIKLLSPANLPIDVPRVLGAAFERYDGKGFPNGLRGTDIPIASRILAVVDAFVAIKAEGYKGRTLESADAMGVIKDLSESLFDPDVVETLIQVVKDDMFVGKMDTAREHLLIADGDAGFTALLEIKFEEAGFRVTVARNGEEALDLAQQNPPDFILSEIDLTELDGFEFMEKLKADDKFAEIPFMYVSANEDTSLITRAFDLGAEDIVQKPVRVEMLFAKVQNMMERVAKSKKAAAPAGAGSGVSGSLSEMNLPDIVQILGAGRRTALLSINSNSEKALIYLEEGRIVNAEYNDLKGEEAFYAIVGWEEGSFTINPEVEITERLIDKNNDSLLLEGFRRLDEGGAKDASEDDIALDGSDFF